MGRLGDGRQRRWRWRRWRRWPLWLQLNLSTPDQNTFNRRIRIIFLLKKLFSVSLRFTWYWLNVGIVAILQNLRSSLSPSSSLPSLSHSHSHSLSVLSHIMQTISPIWESKRYHRRINSQSLKESKSLTCPISVLLAFTGVHYIKKPGVALPPSVYERQRGRERERMREGERGAEREGPTHTLGFPTHTWRFNDSYTATFAPLHLSLLSLFLFLSKSTTWYFFRKNAYFLPSVSATLTTTSTSANVGKRRQMSAADRRRDDASTTTEVKPGGGGGRERESVRYDSGKRRRSTIFFLSLAPN